MWCGWSSSVHGPSADDDCRGVKAEYLRDEASKSLFLHAIYLVIAVNASAIVVWLAFRSAWVPAIALSIPATIFWKNAIFEARRSARLYIAANLDSAD